MLHLRLAYFQLISVVLLTLFPILAEAQSLLPQKDGVRAKYKTMIEMPQGYISGICVIALDGDLFKCCIFNEFGITAMEYTYLPSKGKVKLLSVSPMLDKWYIKRIIKSDLKKVMEALALGNTSFENKRHHISYSFILFAEEDIILNIDGLYNDIPQ